MRQSKGFWLVLCLLAGIAFTVPLQAQETTLIVMGHDSFSVSEEVLQQFEAETGIQVEILLAGDAGSMVNQAVLTANNPQADVIYGVDNTFLGRALEGEIFEPYESPLLAEIPEEFILDADYQVTPINYGDVCINYDVAYFAERQKALPENLRDLTKEDYKGLLAVENPALSSPGLAFLLATIAEFGTDEGEYNYLSFWADLVKNDVLISPDWTTAYYGDFTLAGGDRPLVVSYASSPPAEVIFADPPVEEAPTGSLTADGMCFRQVEFAGILKGSSNIEAAQQFIDFMLSSTFQEDMPLQMFVFPVNPSAELPAEFTDYAIIPANPARLLPAEIDAGREEWIKAWTEVVLR